MVNKVICYSKLAIAFLSMIFICLLLPVSIHASNTIVTTGDVVLTDKSDFTAAKSRVTVEVKASGRISDNTKTITKWRFHIHPDPDEPNCYVQKDVITSEDSASVDHIYNLGIPSGVQSVTKKIVVRAQVFFSDGTSLQAEQSKDNSIIINVPVEQKSLDPLVVTYPEANSWVDLADVKISWEKVQNAQYYDITIKEDESNAVIAYQEVVTEPNYTIPASKLKRGTKYRYCIRANSDNYTSSLSKTMYFLVMPKLASPVLATPETDKMIDLTGLKICWSSVPDAKSYNITIRENKTNIAVAYQEVVFGNSYTIPSNKLKPGTEYRCCVAADAPNYASGLSKVMYFTIPEFNCNEIVKVVILNRNDNPGHNAFMLLDSENRGFYGSFRAENYSGTAKENLKALFSTSGELLIKYLSKNEVDEFYKSGYLYNAVSVQGNTKAYERYDRFLSIQVSKANGKAIYNATKDFCYNTKKYSLLFFDLSGGLLGQNCSQAIALILEKGNIKMSTNVLPGVAYNEMVKKCTGFGSLYTAKSGVFKSGSGF